MNVRQIPDVTVMTHLYACWQPAAIQCHRLVLLVPSFARGYTSYEWIVTISGSTPQSLYVSYSRLLILTDGRPCSIELHLQILSHIGTRVWWLQELCSNSAPCIPVYGYMFRHQDQLGQDELHLIREEGGGGGGLWEGPPDL